MPHRNGSKPAMAAPQANPHYQDIANKYWLNASKLVKVKPKVLKQEIWDPLEKEDFAYSSLFALENLQILER
jgi:intron-binding protein aquarius